MRRLLFILTIFICFNSCNRNNKLTIEGDLYFQLFDLERFFDSPDSVLTKIENSVRTVNIDTISEQDKKMYNLLQYMVGNNLLRKPFIRIRLDSGDIKMLFLDSSEYRQFKQYNWSDLSREDKKIRIKVSVTDLKYDSMTAFNTVKILSVDKIDGKTYWTK